MSSPTQRRNWTTADWSYLAAMSNAFTPNPASPFGERAMTRSASILPTATAIVHIEMLQGFKFLEALAQLAHIRKLLAPSQVHLDMLQGFKLLEALAQLAHIRKPNAPTEAHLEVLQGFKQLEALAQLAHIRKLTPTAKQASVVIIVATNSMCDLALSPSRGSASKAPLRSSGF